MLKGVQVAEPGYACATNTKRAPTYEEVSSGTTPYVEAIRLVYDPEQIAFEEILRVFFASHDGTSLNKQGNDVGPQYASVIFYTTPRQQEKSQHYIDALNKSDFVKPLVTHIEPLGVFYLAEDYHQNYYEHHKDAPYCELVIAPKVEKVGKSFKHLLK